MAIVQNVEAFAVKQALSYLDKDPEKTLPKLLDWFDRFDWKDTLKTQRDIIRNVVMEQDKMCIRDSTCYAKATELIRENMEVLHKCANLLLQKERINRTEFEALFEEEKPFFNI